MATCSSSRSIFGGCFDDPDPEPDPDPEEPEEPTEPPLGAAVRITGIPLPDDPRLPFNTKRGCKHVNLADDGESLFAVHGDWGNSATDATARMNWASRLWDRCIGEPVFDSLPGPHALQDGAGFAFVKALKRFLLWPGAYASYAPIGAAIRNYARGLWWLDPKKLTYTQDRALFGEYGQSAAVPFGGVLDEAKMQILAFGDGVVKRWDVQKGERLPDVPFTLATDPKLKGIVYARTRAVWLDGAMYAIGFRHDGEKFGPKKALLLRYRDGVVTELAAPGMDNPYMAELEIRPATSNGKIVWPVTFGPEGNTYGTLVYTPATNSWVLDTQIPEYGNFIGNAICTLQDGKTIVLAGGVFGLQQTHLWMIEAL